MIINNVAWCNYIRNKVKTCKCWSDNLFVFMMNHWIDNICEFLVTTMYSWLLSLANTATIKHRVKPTNCHIKHRVKPMHCKQCNVNNYITVITVIYSQLQSFSWSSFWLVCSRVSGRIPARKDQYTAKFLYVWKFQLGRKLFIYLMIILLIVSCDRKDFHEVFWLIFFSIIKCR